MSMSKTAKRAAVSAAAAVLLGGITAALILTKPSVDENTESITSSEESAAGIQESVTDKRAENVLRLTVTNEFGNYSFERKTLEDTESGEPQYCWNSKELETAPADDSAIRLFIDNLSSLNAMSTVEESAKDTEKYGLSQNAVKVDIDYDDSTKARLLFGIKNPVNDSAVYCRIENSEKVVLVNYYEIAGVYMDIKKFAKLKMTDSYTGDENAELMKMKISRPDLSEPIALEFMSELADAAKDDDYIPTTFNSHRFVSPVSVEADATVSRDILYGVYDLTFSACEYTDISAEILKQCGLDAPNVTLEFEIGSDLHKLLIGDKSANGYYAVFDDIQAVYSISDDKYKLWSECGVKDMISKRPLSPYIYTVDHLNIISNGENFQFDIDGENKEFFFRHEKLDDSAFKSLYQQLIGSVGEEYYTEQTNSNPVFSVEFCYTEEYAEKLGKSSDILEFLPCDDRKLIVNVNGMTLFKVRQLYLTQILEYLNALVSA